jgi:hypothetical protein
MTIPLPAVLAIIGLIVSANTKMHAVIAGMPVTVPVLWLLAAAMVLGLTAAVLFLIRTILRDGLRVRPAWS